MDSSRHQRGGGEFAFGFILVAIGAVFLMKNMGLIWFRWADLWPLVLIAIGVEGLIRPRRLDS